MGSSASALCSSSHSRSSASDTSLTASSSIAARLPTSVVERKSSTARPHFSSAKRSRIFHCSFYLLVSFRTSAHRIFRRALHSGGAPEYGSGTGTTNTVGWANSSSN